jgi:hypothetical protein
VSRRKGGGASHWGFEKAAEVENRFSADFVGDRGQKIAGLIDSHLVAFGLLEVERDEGSLIGFRGSEKVPDLQGDVGFRAPVIRAPEKAGIERRFSTVRVFEIGVPVVAL